MNKTEVLETVKDINTKIQSLRFMSEENADPFYNLVRANNKLDDATIWLDEFAKAFKQSTEENEEEKKELVVQLPMIEDIHSDKGKIAAKINYLKTIRERLSKYGVKVRDEWAAYCLMTATNYVCEAIAYFERAK